MFRRVHFSAIAMILGGGLLGYAAASCQLNLFHRAQAEPPANAEPQKSLHFGAAQPPSSGKKPNIVLVVMDNFGWGEPGCYGGGILRGAPTPRIDKLASEGMRLLNFNVEAQCTPSRAALMTGRYAIRTGNATVPLETPLYGLTQWEYTMAKMLADSQPPAIVTRAAARNAVQSGRKRLVGRHRRCTA